MDNFSVAILEEIDGMYADWTSEAGRSDAFRMFETVEGLAELRQGGWMIANHTAAHHPVGSGAAHRLFADQFGECEAAYKRWFGEGWTFLGVPFDRDHELTDAVRGRFQTV